MKSIFLIALMALSAPALAGQQWIDGYMRSDGTYVQGHWRSTPDQYRYNNRNSQSNGGYQRDEFSNRSNRSEFIFDNNRNGVPDYGERLY